MSKKKTELPAAQPEPQENDLTSVSDQNTEVPDITTVTEIEVPSTEELQPPVVEEVEATPVLEPLTDVERSTLTAVARRYSEEHKITSSSAVQQFVKDPDKLIDYAFKIQEQLLSLAERLKPFPDAQTIKDLETKNLDPESI